MPNNILITPGSASIEFSGSAANTIRLQVETSGSVAFYGNSGSLFGIADSLSGSLMSVNDISGLPILEVFSDDRVVMGSLNKNTLVVTGSRIGIGKNNPTVALDVSGSLVVSDGITGSLFGTSSWASTAVSSSYAVSASYAETSSIASTSSFFEGYALFENGLDVTGSLTVTGSSTTVGTGVVSGSLTVTNGITGNISSSNVLPITDNTGVVGTAALTWANGQFTNLTVDTALTVGNNIQLGANDQLRMGGATSYTLFHDGANNIIRSNESDLLFQDSTTTRIRFYRTTGHISASGALTASGLLMGDRAVASASAGGTYTSTEQDLLNQIRDTLIKYGMLS